MAKGNSENSSGPLHGTGQYVQRIIKCLEKVNSMSGYRPTQVFADFTQLVEASLDALPLHLTSIAQTGQLAEDTPETKQLFEQIRTRYASSSSHSAGIWSHFSQAFALLLESAEPGLWGAGSYGNFDVGYMGPDVLGHVYSLYANAGQAKWNMQIFTPWNVALMMGRFLVPDGERQVYDRVKQACEHPDNILAHATLLAGLTIDDPQQARDWFFNRVLPAALPYYQPITVGDPAGVGSGVLLLAAAACFPEWAVRLGYVVFQGIDNDPECVRMARINCMLYNLNGYSLKFAEALQRLNAQTSLAQLPRTPAKAYQEAVATYQEQQPTLATLTLPAFEDLFRRQPAKVLAEV
jgi:hypothetical protein